MQFIPSFIFFLNFSHNEARNAGSYNLNGYNGLVSEK